MSVLCSRARGWLLSPTMLVLRRHHGAIGTPVADLAECAKEAALPSVDLCLRLRALLRLLHLEFDTECLVTMRPKTTTLKVLHVRNLRIKQNHKIVYIFFFFRLLFVQ